MTGNPSRFRLASIALIIATAPGAFAHAGYDELLRIDVEAGFVKLSMSLDGKNLLAFDSNGDGKLSKKEFTTASDSIAAWIDENIVFVGRDHARAKPTFSDLPIDEFDQLGDSDAVEHIRVLRGYPVGDGTGEMMIRFNLFECARSQRNYLVWNAGKTSEGVLTPEVNVVMLGAMH